MQKASLKPRPRVSWLCNSAIGTSETFLMDNLNLLQGLYSVMAFSGNPPAGAPNPHIEALNFDDVPQQLHHVIRKKLTGRDTRTLKKRRRCRKQLIKKLTAFKPDLLWIEFGTTAHIAADLINELGVPYIIAVHGFDITREFSDAWYASEFIRLANNSAAVVCASHHTRNICLTAGVKSDKSAVVRLPIDGGRFKNSGQEFQSPSSFVHLGRLVEKKGPIQTVMAFEKVLAQLPNARLTIIGEGPLRGAIKQRIQDLNIEHAVTLTGALSQNEAISVLQKHAIFCQHSVTGKDGDQEGFALSPAEAALLEMPVVSTLHNGIPEHVQNGVTGTLVREWDIDAMANAMINLAKNPEQAKSMGKAGRKNILSLCDPEKRRLELDLLISSIL